MSYKVIYAVTSYAERLHSNRTETSRLTQVFRGEDFEYVYKMAQEDCEERWPVRDGWGGHQVSFCQVPHNWIVELANSHQREDE